MLRGLCTELAVRGWTVSVVARGHAGLGSLRQEVAARTGRPDAINPVPLDYADIGALALGVRTAAVAHGPIDLAACYIHSTAPLAPIVVADTVASATAPCTYIHIVGSDAPDVLQMDSNRDEISASPGLRYRRVILGFVPGEGGSRWLTDDEICRGVLSAVANANPEQVVGEITPWDRRPR